MNQDYQDQQMAAGAYDKTDVCPRCKEPISKCLCQTAFPETREEHHG